MTADVSHDVVAITGASGRIGRRIVPLLDRPGRTLRLVDTDLPDRVQDGPWGEVSDRVELRRASIEDERGIRSVLDGADAVVHLAAQSSERPWEEILRANIDGTQKVLEAARLGGATRVFLASSVHAVGFADVAEVASTPVLVPRPDTFYGVSKAAVEALGSVYADRYGLSIVSARICAYGDGEPNLRHGIAHWLSAGDAARLVEAALALDDGRHHIVWGVSANSPGVCNLSAGRAIGFEPQDDAYAIVRARGLEPEAPPTSGPIGGTFTEPEHPLGERW
ncbi:NAD-dependent epimerase/dehydratase family protein [Agromyces sp. Marseille-Q5079]|uniref:NAD-dependent epimerase/dehydratase family protein n=1 Tax=Agromyces sp. Marseille-Q5079 TaxID=3439059 RepID=UPI003D9C916C